MKSNNSRQPDSKDSGGIIPKFKFGSTLWNVAKIASIFIAILVILCGVRWIVRWLGFTVSFERVFASFALIAASAVWPCFILIIIYLFKDNLETVAELIGKTWHGDQGAIRPANGTKEEDDESAEDCKGMDSVSREFQNRMYRAFENYALDRLQQDEDVIVKRHVRVFDSLYAFDGAFEKGDSVYVVEVKMRTDKESLRRFLLRADGIYQDLPRSRRKRFKTLICVLVNDGEKGVANARRKLSALREGVTFPVEFRFYPFNYNEKV